MKRFETLLIAIPDPTPEEQVEGQARLDRETLVHTLVHHPWLVAMAEGDWLHRPGTPPPPPAGHRPTPVTGPADHGAGRLILGEPAPAAAQVPSDPIDHPAHYTSHPSGIEPIAITRHESFLRGNALKYLLRAGRKDPDPRLDLRKARRYIDFELEDLEQAVSPP